MPKIIPPPPPTPDLGRTKASEDTSIASSNEASQTYTLNGRSLTIKKKATARTATQAYYPKSERVNLTKKERMDLLDKIQAKQQRDLFKSITVSVNDPQKMTNTRSVAELLTENRRNLNKYDLLDVYSIVFPVAGSFDENSTAYGTLRLSDNKPEQVDLFTHYLKLTTSEVAESSKWYSSFVDDDHIQEDLNWSLAYYEKNVESDLYSKVYTKMSSFPYDSQGGPLFLKILLDMVTTSSEGNLKALETILDSYQIKRSSPGEDIEVVVGLFTSIIETIIALRDNDLPSDAVRKLLKIFQTTSVDDFNDQFGEMERAYVRTSIRAQLTEFNIAATGEKGLLNDKHSAKYVLAYAERAYRDLVQSGEWDKCLQKPPGKSAFNATGGEQPTEVSERPPHGNTESPCFNCGSTEHLLKDCPLPRDSERIARNKAKHPVFKRFQNRRPHKWRLPEAGENNKRVVDGKPYTWDPNTGRSGRWTADHTPSDGQPNNGNPPLTVDMTPSGTVAQANVGSSQTLDTVLQNLLSDGSSGSVSGNTTLPSQRTDYDPMQKKIQLLMAKAKITEALEGL